MGLKNRSTAVAFCWGCCVLCVSQTRFASRQMMLRVKPSALMGPHEIVNSLGCSLSFSGWHFTLFHKTGLHSFGFSTIIQRIVCSLHPAVANSKRFVYRELVPCGEAGMTDVSGLLLYGAFWGEIIFFSFSLGCSKSLSCVCLMPRQNL